MKFPLGFCLRSLLGLASFTVSISAYALTDHIICRLVDPFQAPEVAASYGISVKDTTAPQPFVLFVAPPGTDVDFIQLAMQGDPRIVWAEDDEFIEAPETASGKGSVVNVIGDRGHLYAQNTGLLQQIGWTTIHSRDPERPVRLAILDTGLSPFVPRLWNRVVGAENMLADGLPPHDVPGNLDTNANGEVDDGLGHGTMIAGLVDFLATNVDLVIARVADSDGVANSWTVIKGLAFAVTQGAEVANVSMGAVNRIAAVGDVLDWTETHQLLVFAPVGNLGVRDALFPAGYSEVVCVSGVLPTDIKAPFSNWGGDADLAAPATGIQSTWWDGNTGIWSGTSFAAPMAAAAAADALRRVPPTAPSVLRAAIRRGGDNIDALNPDYAGELGLRLNIRKIEANIRKAIR